MVEEDMDFTLNAGKTVLTLYFGRPLSILYMNLR